MPSIKTYLPRDTREQSRIPIPGRFSGVRRPGCQPISSVFPGSWPKNNKNSTEKRRKSLNAPGQTHTVLPIVVFACSRAHTLHTYIFTLPFSFQFISFIYAIFYVLIHFLPVLVVVGARLFY